VRPLDVCAAVPHRMYGRQLHAITQGSVFGAIPSRVNLDHLMLIERNPHEDAFAARGTTLVARPGACAARVVGGLWTGNYSRSFFGPNRPGRQRWTELMEQPRRTTVTRHHWVSAQIATAACTRLRQPSRGLVMGAAGTNRPNHAGRGRIALGISASPSGRGRWTG
jgi:hypothetical protein